MTLPLAVAWALIVWLLNGLWQLQLWPQMACYAASVYLLIELSNQNALLRIRSRMVTSMFILLSATSPFLFSQFTSGFVQLCFVIALLPLFQAYQQPQATGTLFYAFLSISVASLARVEVLCYVPLLWLLTATQLHALSWRSWLASLIGLLTPYWLVFFWLLSPFGMTEGGGIDLTPLADHFTRIADLQPSAMRLTLPHVLSIAATVLLATAGALHFWQYSYEDKIRIRLLYGFFSVMTAASLLMAVLMPSLYDVLMPIAFVTASPLAAHVMTFTSSRLSNILFLLAIVLLMTIAVVNTLQPPLG